MLCSRGYNLTLPVSPLYINYIFKQLHLNSMVDKWAKINNFICKLNIKQKNRKKIHICINSLNTTSFSWVVLAGFFLGFGFFMSFFGSPAYNRSHEYVVMDFACFSGKHKNVSTLFYSIGRSCYYYKMSFQNKVLRRVKTICLGWGMEETLIYGNFPKNRHKGII